MLPILTKVLVSMFTSSLLESSIIRLEFSQNLLTHRKNRCTSTNTFLTFPSNINVIFFIEEDEELPPEDEELPPEDYEAAERDVFDVSEGEDEIDDNNSDIEDVPERTTKAWEEAVLTKTMMTQHLRMNQCFWCSGHVCGSCSNTAYVLH